MATSAWREAVWASMDRAVTSPAAYTPGTEVRMWVSTVIPRSQETPRFSRPKPFKLGLRPTETRISEPEALQDSPSGVSYTTSFPSMAVTLQLRWNSTPFLAYCACSMAEISSSMGPRILGSISTTVTFVPMELKKLANSIPITPPPIITRLSGFSSSWRISRLVTTAPDSASPGMGGTTADDPVQRSSFSA